MKRERGGGKGDQAVDQAVDINMARVLMLLSQGVACGPDGIVVDVRDKSSAPGRVFECKTCNRQFPSFQALGGHRASHKKPRLVDDGHGRTPTKPRVHECSICGVEFALGQALGGHMRRHRAEGFVVHGSGREEEEEREKVEKRKVIGTDGRGEKRVLEALDLNLTPTENDAELRLLTFSLGPPLVR